MPANTKLIKTRIRSVKNTKKVTKAMELVAGAKMRKAVDRALETREYASLAWELALRLSKSKTISKEDYLHNFFRPADDPKKFLLVVFSSNRGLCGAFNSSMIRQIIAFVKEKGNENVEIIAVGKRVVTGLSVYGINPRMAYEKKDSAKRATSVVNIANYVYEKFKTSEVDQVLIAYTDYESSLVQNPVIRPLFPFQLDISVTAGVKDLSEKKQAADVEKLPQALGYIHEPSKRDVLSYLVPRLGELQLFQALLESNASEHSARMVAMKNATDAASEMLDDLTLQFNRARQAAITQEIAEISAGMAAIT